MCYEDIVYMSPAGIRRISWPAASGSRRGPSGREPGSWCWSWRRFRGRWAEAGDVLQWLVRCPNWKRKRFDISMKLNVFPSFSLIRFPSDGFSYPSFPHLWLLLDWSSNNQWNSKIKIFVDAYPVHPRPNTMIGRAHIRSNCNFVPKNRQLFW